MDHLALFNGIGGFQLAAHWVGWNNVAHCEIDDKCNQVVKKHFPNSICHTDIKLFNAKPYAGSINIISGGFPCQPFSVAGKQGGKTDVRALWYEMLRIIREVQPAWVVGENVIGIIGMELDNVLDDLESEGYKTQTFIIPASGIGAWHERQRIWIVAQNTNNIRCNGSEWQKESDYGRFREFGAGNIQWICKQEIITNSNNAGCKEQWEPIANGTQLTTIKCHSGWKTEPGMGRVANGISGRVDRLKQLGNAIVPQVAYQIFKSIAEYENLYNENPYNQK